MAATSTQPQLDADLPKGNAPTIQFDAIVARNMATYFGLTGNYFKVVQGEKTCFKHEKAEIVIGVEQLRAMGVSDPFEFHFIILHELGHLKEFRDDPQGYRELINECNRDADGELIFSLFNSVMDIYVNRNAANKAAVFQEGAKDFSSLVKSLYLNKAFPNHDLSQLSLTEQYKHYLLLTGMGIARAYTVSEPIAQIFSAGVPFAGKIFSYDDFIQAFLVPVRPTRNHDTHVYRANIGDRARIIRNYILPTYRALIDRDRQEGREPSGSGDVLVDQIGSSGSNQITQTLTREEAEKLLNTIEVVVAEGKLTAKERQQRARSNQTYQVAQAARAQQPDDFHIRLRRVEPIVTELEGELLQVRAPAEVVVKRHVSLSNRGILNLPQVKRRFDQVQTNPRSAPVMTSERVELSTVLSPLNLRICLLPDLSGSMASCVEELRDSVIALAATTARLSLNHRVNNADVTVELAVYGFNHAVNEILDPTPKSSLRHIAAAYEQITTGGGTSEHTALEHLHTKLRELAARRMRSRDTRPTLTLAISLTDGDTDDVERAQAARQALEQDGVECFGVFLRSGGSPGETFHRVWEGREYEIDTVRDLPKIVSQISHLVLRNRRIGTA